MPRFAVVVACAFAAFFMRGPNALAQVRVLGVDISYWNCGTGSNGISQADWDTGFSDAGGNRKFVYIRATRGGTTGLSQTEGTPSPHDDLETLSRRYDDSRFFQNIQRAVAAGFYSGAYHFGRPEIAGNTGTDEANHFMEYAGIYMRPGFMMPVFDLEAGDASDNLAQFSIDFSNRIYQALGIRPGMYINGNHTNHLVNSSTNAQDDLIAQPVLPTGSGPSVVGPAFPMLWNSRYGHGTFDQEDPGFDVNLIPIQTGSPRNNGLVNTSYYGPWDDYGDTNPWSFWQYASVLSVPGFNNVDSTIDGNVSAGDIEYVRNFLVPAVWWGNNSGDWSTLANWNSGQTIGTFSGTYPIQGFVTPHLGAGQATPYDTTPLTMAPRLPGKEIDNTHYAGNPPSPMSGEFDTVILERQNADITVTLSTGTHNIRKMYMRETLNITGGTLTINYDPTYRLDNNALVKHGGPLSAQFSGPVTLSGGSLNVHTLQIDSAKVFTLGGGTLTFNKINLISNAATKISVSGNVNINPLNNATAAIARSGSSGTMDLTGGTRTFTVGNGTADVDLSVAIPIVNGGFIKSGAGTMKIDGANTFTGDVTVNGGTLRLGHATGVSNTSTVTVNSGARLEMNGVADTFEALMSSAGQNSGVVDQGSAALTISNTTGSTTYGGTITGTGSFTKSGASTQILTGNNSFGSVVVSAGTLLLHGANTNTGTVTVNGGTLGGAGSLSGNVIVNSGAHLSPGASVESFGVGSLTLNAGAVLDIELFAVGASDRIDVGGQLTLNGGSINLSDAGGMALGDYTLLSYGSISGNVASLNATGPAGYSYELYDIGGSIQLVVGLPGDFNDDGFVDTQDYVVYRKKSGAPNDLQNDNNIGGIVGAAHYNLWRTNFGRNALDGGGGQSSSTPEPSAALLMILGCMGSIAGRRCR